MAFDLASVKAQPLTFDTTGTQTSVAAGVTSTSKPTQLPRGPYLVQVTAIATGTSGVGATVIWQGSNDDNAWVNISSATATATQAGTGTTFAGAAIAVTDTRFAYGRAATVAVTGTGNAQVWLGA